MSFQTLLTGWDDPVASKNLAESYGLKVNFIKVGKPAENIGIINGWIEAVDGEYGYTGVVKNYRSESKTVEIMTGRGTSGNASKSLPLTSLQAAQTSSNLQTWVPYHHNQPEC